MYYEDFDQDIPINNDQWSSLRNSENGTDIGYVHLALSVIKTAIEDLIWGEPHNIVDASLFFWCSESSTYPLFAAMLGMIDKNNKPIIPQIVLDFVNDNVIPTEEQMRELDTLFKEVTVDHIGAKNK